MLAETCNNIGKLATENTCPQSQDSSLPISPSCSSSCSAPKFSPNSLDLSPTDPLISPDDLSKDKMNKDKGKKRKAPKRDQQEYNDKRMPPEQNGVLNSPYTISEFLKMNHFPPNPIVKTEPTSGSNPFYNQLLNQNLNQQFQPSSIWKVKPTNYQRLPFPMGGYQNVNFQMNASMMPPMFRPHQPNLMHELNHLYNNYQPERALCDCVVCCHKKNIEKNMLKVDPVLFNSLNCLRFNRPGNNRLVPGMMPPLMPQPNSNGNGSAIKYCMYCGNYIPQIQSLLNHIQSEHVDQINATFQPKIDPLRNFNFNMESLQSKEMKSRDIFKQLHMLYDSEQAEDHGGDKSLVMR